MAKRKSGKQHLSYQDRCRRQARHLVWHGKRLVGDDDDFVGGIHYPKLLISREKAEQLSNWAVNTPLRWWVRATVYCRDDSGNDYAETVEAETQQAALVNSLSDWRISLMRDAHSRVNHNHAVAEGYETGVIG